MDISRVNPNTMAGLGGSSSQIVRVGGFAFIAGQVAQNERGEVVGEGDINAQVIQVFANLKAATDALGGSLKNLVKTTTFLTSSEYYSAVRKFRTQEYGNEAPANSTVIVSALARPEFLLEIEAIVYIE